jgi:hypothetical protein
VEPAGGGGGWRAVPRFYFHLRNDMDVPDEEGREFPDLDAARASALDLGRFEVSEMVKTEGRVVLHHRIDIEDEQGRMLDSVPFRDVLSVEDQPG